MTRNLFIAAAAALSSALMLGHAAAQSCPEKNIQYWQAFPAGGESDISARHQQAVLKKRCPKIETIVQYKPGAGGGLMWAQMNQLPGDGFNVVGVNLPHIVLQPLEGQVQYKTEDVTPVYWFHYTPDAIIVHDAEPDQDVRGSRQDGQSPAREAHVRRLRHELGEPRRARAAEHRSGHSRRPTCRSRARAT